MQWPYTQPTIHWVWVFLCSPTEEMAKERANPLRNRNSCPGPWTSRPSCLPYRRWSASTHTAREEALLARSHNLSTSPKRIFKIPTSWAQDFPWQRSSVYAICPLWLTALMPTEDGFQHNIKPVPHARHLQQQWHLFELRVEATRTKQNGDRLRTMTSQLEDTRCQKNQKELEPGGYQLSQGHFLESSCNFTHFVCIIMLTLRVHL